jgi:hypothetical protein
MEGDLSAPYRRLVPLVESAQGWIPIASGDRRVFECGYLSESKRWKDFMFKMRFYEATRVWVLSTGSSIWLR